MLRSCLTSLSIVSRVVKAEMTNMLIPRIEDSDTFRLSMFDFPPQIEGRDAVEHSDLVFGEGDDDIFLGHSRFVFSPCK